MVVMDPANDVSARLSPLIPSEMERLSLTKPDRSDDRKLKANAVTVLVGGVLGTVAACLPVVLLLAVVSINRSGDGQLGLGICLGFIVFGTLGMATGLIGGFIYCSGQRFLTAACPSLGIVLLGIVLGFWAMFDIPWTTSANVALLVTLFAGPVLSFVCTYVTWRPISK
jgi:hypothetical protein